MAGRIFLILGIILGLIMSIIGLFVGNIILFDGIGISILVRTLLNVNTPIHSAICLVIEIVVFILLWLLHSHKYGFWIISGIMSVMWGLVATVIIIGSKSDKIWQVVVFIISVIVFMFLHIQAKEKI